MSSTFKSWIIRIWARVPMFLALIVLCVFAAWLYQNVEAKKAAIAAQKAAQLKEERPKINVITLRLRPEPIQDRINFPGIVKAWVRLDVLSEVQGRITQLSVKEGDTVRKGQLLAKIDARDYKNALLSIKASYKAALSSVNRLKELHQKQLATQSQLDEAVSRMDSLKANMDTASLNLERCAIRAPISGIINLRYVEKGQYINMADQILEVIQFDRVKIAVGIPESDVDAVRGLDRFRVTIDALDKTFTARKYFLSKTADESARLYNLEMIVDNSGYEILPDMFARVEIIKREVKNGISAPLYSILTRNNQRLAYVEKEGIAHVRNVSLGLQDKWRIEIKEGLQPDERLIVMGHRDVSDGQPIHVIRTIDNIEELEK
ncbi:MAG: RND family efflux transporter MFP subunit [Candidatus Magnetoglobus multicellularis str. Araruama]|uniref:RND family efflux transporter MFP subunit n=1 Tax=Candidatus Magnetoglobus multicellularis str. Araruama TaxID=890399 RepID=A0A1V1PHI1_9BACT|nr:MAG: RND family efflux transporter MFP subunit [Candidatus Magnetoglobus multicellularis str. Araruama]